MLYFGQHLCWELACLNARFNQFHETPFQHSPGFAMSKNRFRQCDKFVARENKITMPGICSLIDRLADIFADFDIGGVKESRIENHIAHIRNFISPDGHGAHDTFDVRAIVVDLPN